MKFTDSLKGIGSPIAFYPDLIPLVGSKTAAMLICQLAYWTGKQHNPDGWIYKTQEEWFFETGLSDKEQRTARRALVERGYIEERIRGIPRRLEYRLLEKPLNEVWDVWMIAVDLKKRFQILSGSYGVNLSRGIQIEELQSQMEKFRQVICQCYNVAEGFFDNCRKLKITPVDIVDKFREKLSELAGTLDKFNSSLWAGQFLTNGQVSSSPTSRSVPTPQADQYLTEGSLAGAGIPVVASVPAPSKITPKTSTVTSHESGQAGAENTHTWGATFKKEDQEKCVNSKDLKDGKIPEEKTNTTILKDVQIPEEEECNNEIVNSVQVEVLQDTQQQPKDKELNSQGQNCIFMEANIPAGGGAEMKENAPNWVLELQEKVRLGQTLKRPELLELANYRLGDYANIYRHSGRVLDASPDDIRADFLKFVQWHSFHNNPDINYVLFSVKKAERQPEQWDVLLSWLRTWDEVQKDPKSLETMLSAKVSSEGKRCNTQDLVLKNRLNAEKAMTVENWWEAI
jgi:hypothetical protein